MRHEDPDFVADDGSAGLSPDDRATLARWSGWGAVPQLFDSDDFAEQRAELRQLLTDEEYAAARRSTQNAHYTDAALVSAIWDGMARLGFAGGEVLEPGCGAGHFIGLAPDSARMHGVEREPVSAAIANLLYPQADITEGSFADIDAAEGAFDVAVGNVPFAKVKLRDDKHNPGRQHSIHNHFILKSLRLTRPGGIVAVLTSRYTMDARNPAARAEMALLADLVGAVRLPTGAHRRAAGTEAVTDLLILRRRDDDAKPDPVVPFSAWEKALPAAVGDNGEHVEINQYFLDNPQNVLGEFALTHGMYNAEDLKVRGDLDALPQQFAAALARIADNAADRGLAMTPRRATVPRPATALHIVDPRAAEFQGFLTALPDGGFTRRIGSQDTPFEPPKGQAAELRSLLGVRDAAMALLRAERDSIDDTPQITHLREQLNTVYDAYVAEFGPVNRFTERPQLRQGWHVFGDWCDRNHHDKVPASRDAVLAYLTELRGHGLGQDILQRHLDAIVKGHETAFGKAVKKAAKQEAVNRRRNDPGLDKAAVEQALLETMEPESLLALAGIDDPRLSARVAAAGQQIVDGAPKTTPKGLDLDALGLRTTMIIRPPQGEFRTDPFSNVARALEKFDPTTQTARKANIFTRRVVNPPRQRLGADTPEEALSICLDTHSRIDLPEIARLLGLPGEDEARAALEGLVFTDPDTGEPVWKPFYLSGNVRQKLTRARLAAEDDPAFEANVAALEPVIPEDLGPEDIEVRLGSWIGPEYVREFLQELLEDENVEVESVAGLWRVATNRSKLSKPSRLAAEEIWAGGGLDAYDLTERLLYGAPIRVMKTIEVTNPDGEVVEKEVLDPEATEEATDKAVEINDRFADWIWEKSERAERVMRLYNDEFNAEIPTDFSGIELSLPGLSQAFTLREHQKIAVARVVYQGGTGLVHEVGAGKTLEMIVGVMERKRRGLADKPVIVVPNDSIAEQFTREWLQAYPEARLLTGLSADLANDKKKGKDGRADFVARVAADDWDAVIMTKESFQRIPLPPEIQEKFLSAELEDLRQEKEAHADLMSDSMTKRIESAMENAEQRLEKRLAEIDRDTAGMTFVDAGFDFVVVDEAQNYKNGLVLSAIPDLVIEGSNRAIDLDMKLGHLQDRFGTARVVLATATPWTGKYSEVYLWLRRLGHRLPRFDVWARTYVTVESYMEMTPGGTLRSKSRTRRPINEPELWRSLRLTSDIKMKRDLNLKVPRLRDGRIEVIEVIASPQARIFTLDLARRERILHGPPTKGTDNHLVIAHDGQLGALDLRTVGITTPEPQKVDVIAADIHAEWHAAKDNVYLREDGTEHPVRGGLILVFCDESTPSKHWNFYDELRTQLHARGLPEGSVRYIHEATSPQRKADMLAAGREGAISVLVGSTMKMGAGINVQTRVIGGYEITGHWRPDITAQAIGRAERQGNLNEEYFWKRVVLAPSMDAKKWEITAQKQAMFAPLYASVPPERTREIQNDEGQSLADVMAAATGDPRYKEKADLDVERKTLNRQRSSHGRTQQALKLSITRGTERIPRLQALAERQDAVAEHLVSTDGDKFAMTVGKRTFSKRPEAAQALRDLLAARMAAAPQTRVATEAPIGSIGGFEITARFRPLERRELRIHVTFPAADENTPGFYLDPADLPGGIGLVTRLENQLKNIAAAGEKTRRDIADEQAGIEKARTAVGKPFPGEQRLAEVTRRRAELITQLSEDDDDVRELDEDPDSPEAQARRERSEARMREFAKLFDDAVDTARLLGLAKTKATTFGSWYREIAGPVAAEQRPSIEQSLDVWLSIGQPGSHDRTVLAPQGAAPRPAADPVATGADGTAQDPAASASDEQPSPAAQLQDPHADLDLPAASPAAAGLAGTAAAFGQDRPDRSVAEYGPSDDEAGRTTAPITAAAALDAAATTEASAPDAPSGLPGFARGTAVLESLRTNDLVRRWTLLEAEIAAAGYTHIRRAQAGSGRVDHDARQVLTDEETPFEHELRSLAAHVETLREDLNQPAASDAVAALIASDAALDPDRSALLRLVVENGPQGTAAQFIAEQIQQAALLYAIASAAAGEPVAPLLAPNGDPITGDAGLAPWIGYNRAPLTCGDLDIELVRSETGIHGVFTPGGGNHGSYRLRLPSSPRGEGPVSLDAVIASLAGAGEKADEHRARAIGEMARARPLAPAAAEDSAGREAPVSSAEPVSREPAEHEEHAAQDTPATDQAAASATPEQGSTGAAGDSGRTAPTEQAAPHDAEPRHEAPTVSAAPVDDSRAPDTAPGAGLPADHEPAAGAQPHAPDTEPEKEADQDPAVPDDDAAADAAPPPPTLAGIRAMAAEHGLDVTVARVGTETFVTVHEPGVPVPPVLSLPADRASVVDGAGRPLAPDAMPEYLARYREAMDPALFTIATTVRDWPRRVAQLAPHLLPGEFHRDQVAVEFATAAVLVDRGRPNEAEDALRRAEAAAGPHVLTPERELRVVRAITDHAAGYASTGTPGRYIAESHVEGGTTWREWDWIEAYIAAHPEVLATGLPDHKKIRAREAEELAVAQDAGKRFDLEAKHAFKRGDYAKALDLIDTGEIVYPDPQRGWRLRRQRAEDALARREGREPAEDALAEPGEHADDRETAAPAPQIPPTDGPALHAAVNAAAAAWFDRQLDEHAAAQEFLRSRLGGREPVDRVRARDGDDRGKLTIGYAPDRWDGLCSHLLGEGFAEQDLIDAGVAIRAKTGNLVDLFRHRIVFAVRDEQGRIAGFTGRTLHSDDILERDERTPKYLNTRNTDLFVKSRLLLGLHEQRDLAGHASPVFVEGPFDVAALMALAPPERPMMFLATCGTALTDSHLAAVDALVPVERPRVYGGDNDAAGRTALAGQIETALVRYPHADALVLPEGRDPAEWAVQAVHDAPDGGFRGSPPTRWAMEALVDLRIAPYADRLGEDYEVEASIKAARDAAAALALVEPERTAELEAALVARLHIDPVHLAEFVGDARQARDRTRPRQPAAAAAPASAASGPAAPDGAEDRADPVVQDESTAADRPGSPADPGPDIPDPHQHDEDTAMDDRPEPVGDGPWLLDPVARRLDEQTPLSRLDRTENAADVYDALAASVTGDALDRLTESGGHEALDLLLQADRLEAIAQAAERAQHAPVILVKGDTEQRLDPDRIDGAFALLAQRPGERLALRCGDLTFRCGTDRAGTYIAIEPAVWRSDDEQPWADRARLSAAATRPDAAGQAREQVQDRIGTARARATLARGRLTAVLAGRGLSDGALARAGLADNADRLGTQQVQRIGAQLARVDLLRQFAVAGALPASGDEFTFGGEPLADPGPALAEVSPFPQDPHHSEVLRWRGLEVSTRWTDEQEKPFLCLAVAPAGHSGSDRRPPLMFEMTPEWFTDTGYAPDRIVEFVRRTVANAERIALRELQAAQEAIGAPEREDRERAEAAAERTAAAEEQTAAAREHAAAHHTLVIEHNASGTLVHGSSKDDTALHKLLHTHKFKFSKRQEFWFLPRPWHFDTRSVHARLLARDLRAAGRAHEMWDNEIAAPETPPPPLPEAEPFTTRKQFTDAERAATSAYWAVHETASGRRLLGFGNGRPDAEALRTARDEISQHRFQGDPAQSLDRYVALYRAAKILYDNLVAERKNAPKMMDRLKLLVERSGRFAAGLRALIEQNPGSGLIADVTTGHEAAAEETVAVAPSPEPEQAQLDMFATAGAETADDERRGEDIAAPAETPADTDTPAEPEASAGDPRGEDDAPEREARDALPELTARQKADLRGTYSGLHDLLTAASFTHVQEPGIGVPGAIDVEARTATTDPDLPPEEKIRCLVMQTDKMRLHRARLAEQARTALAAAEPDEATAARAGELASLASQLDTLAETAAGAKRAERRWVVPTHSFVSHQLNDGEVETALHGFARAAQQGISPAEALKGKQIVVGPRSTGLTWHTLNLEFSRNDDNGVVLSIATADRRNRDEVAVDPRWLDIESGGAQIRSAFEQRVAGLGARADAARLEMLALLAADTAAAHEGPVDTAARLADTAPADATTATEPTPEPEPSPEPAAESAAEPEHEAGDAPAAAASAQPPEAGPSTAVHDDQDSRLTLAEEALGGGKPDLDAVLGHWQGMPNPHPDDPASAETWDYDRDRLINEVRGARKTQLSPGGVLLAYKRNQRTPLWTVVQTSTGHPVIDTAAVAIPPHSAPRPSTRYTVLGLPDVAVPRVLAALERGQDPDGHRIDWTDHASMTRTAAQWRMPGLNGTVVSGDDAAGVGLRHLLAAALLDAAALHPQAVCGSPAFNRALYAALPDENALWGTRIPGDLAEDFRDVATQFSAEGPALQNPRQQHRKLRKRKQDDRTYAVVRLAATLAFTGRPHAAVQLLQNRADELEPSDETRHFLYGSYRLRHLVRGIEELFSPVDTELERLLSATPGDRVVATASKGGPGIGSVWIVTGPSRRTTIPSTGNWQVEMRVDLMHDSGPVHAALHIAPGERSRRVWFDYDHSQPDNSADRVWSDDQLYHASADNWAFVPAGEQLPDTAADLEALTRRAATAFADGTSRPDHAVADPSEADAEQNGTEAGEKVPASAAVADEEPAPVLSSVDSSGARGDAPESTAEPEAPRAEQPREHTDNAPPADIESISAPGKEPARPQDELDSLTRRAATPFADGTPGPDPAAAEQPGDHAEQTRSDADGNNSAPAATDDEEPAPPLPSADSAGAPADAAGDGAEPARAKARALIEGIDAEFLAAAEQELDESQTGESALELLVTGLDLHNPRLVPPPVAEEIELAVHNVTRGTGFDPDFRAQLAIRRGRGAEDAAWLAALADGFSARRGPDDPLGRVLARTGIDKAASDLHDMVELMGIYGNFAVPGRPAPDGGPAQPDTGPGNSASAEAAAEELESARAHARALLEGIDDKTLATAARLAGDKLDLLLRALGDGPAAVMDKPVASVVVDVVGSVADDIGFDPDRRARQAVESGLGVAAATAITAFADALADRSGRDDPLGRVLPRIRADDLVSGLHAVADRMGVHGGFAVPGRPVSAPEDTAEQDRGDRGLDQDAEPGFDTEYDEAGFAFVPGVTNIGELFLAHGWVLQEELPSEIGGMRNEHWYRHDVSVAVGITPDERVLTTVARRHGPWDSPDWQEAEFTSGQKLRDLVEQAGLHGVARPARLPGLWRVENADYADEARAAVEADAEARLVTRAADAAQPAWSFADDGQGVPLAPPLPEVPVTDRNSLLRYILGERYDEKETRNLASIVISGRARNGTQPVAALQQLREIDAEVYRRAFAATAGFRTGKKLDVARAREALVRLAEGDPALPLNAAGQYAEITHDNEPQAPDSDGWIPVDRPRPVRGLVADLRPDTSLGRVSVLIDRDVVSADGAPRALQVLDVDGRVSLLDPATRPSPEERATASAAMQESIEARKRALGIGDHTAPPTAAEPAAAAETPVAEEPAAEDAGAARDAGPVQEQETAAADPDVPVLRLPDGRELTHLPDPGRAELPLYAAIAREAYQRTEPGRFRLIVAREADGGRSWWWALHRIDADGAIAGIGIRPRTSMHATAERALAAAQRRLAPLEQALETPVEPVPGLSGPFASVTFVPEWGDVAGQLEHMEWPDAVRSHRPASVATTIVRRMFLSVSPEENARWLLGDGYSPESAAEVSRQLRELAAVIRASGLPDAVPGTHRRISGELAATGAAITARLEQTAPPPAAAEAIGEDIPLPPEPEDREDANLPPDLAELDVEPVFLDLDRWRHHDRPDSEGSGVPEPAARAHNHLIDLLTPATVAALEDRSRRLIAHQVQDSYRYDLLAAAVRRAGRSQQLYRTGSDDRGFLRRSSDDLEAWDSVMEALGADPDSYGQVSWGQIRFTVERGRGRTVAVIAVADLDSGYVDVIDRIPYVAGESGSDRLDRIGHVLRVATEGASSRAVLARGFATESLDAYRRSAREAASARLEALPGVLPSSAGERRNEIYYELQDIKRAREAVLTLARGRLDALEFGGPADDADAFEEYPGERPVSDPGAVLATPEVRDTPGAESTNIFWRGFLVYTSHSHDGRLELVLCESHGLPSSLLSIPLTAEQFTPEGVLAALHDTMATLEQTVLDRTVAATAAVADLEAETRAAPGNDAGPHAEAAAAPDPAPAEPAAAPGDQPPPTRSGAPSAPADVEDAEQPGLFDLAPPPAPEAAARPPAAPPGEGETRPGPPDSAERATPAPTSPGEVAPEAADDAEPAGLPRAPLTADDIALALGRLHGTRLAEFLRAMSNGAKLPLADAQERQVTRAQDEPDPGAAEHVAAQRQGLEVRVDTATEQRTGRPSWKAVHEWLRAGLHRTDLRMLSEASDARGQFAARARNFAAAGEGVLYRTALGELDAVVEQATASIVARALRAHKSGQAPKPWNGRGRDPLLRNASDNELSEAQRTGLARIRELAAVIPADPHGRPAPLADTAEDAAAAAQVPAAESAAPATKPPASAGPAAAAATPAPAAVDRAEPTPPAAPTGPAEGNPLDLLRFDPAGPGAARQLSDLAMPEPVRLHEPSRLAYVVAGRLIQNRGVNVQAHATWLSNVAASPAEAAEAAGQIRHLAALITATGLPDDLPGDSGQHLVDALVRTREALLARLGLPLDRQPPPAHGPDPAAVAKETAPPENPEPTETSARETAAVLPELDLGWGELEGMAEEAGYTVVRQRHLAEPSTDHDLRVIAIPHESDKERQREQLGAEIAALLREPRPVPPGATAAPAAKFYPSSPAPAAPSTTDETAAPAADHVDTALPAERDGTALHDQDTAPAASEAQAPPADGREAEPAAAEAGPAAPPEPAPPGAPQDAPGEPPADRAAETAGDAADSTRPVAGDASPTGPATTREPVAAAEEDLADYEEYLAEKNGEHDAAAVLAASPAPAEPAPPVAEPGPAPEIAAAASEPGDAAPEPAEEATGAAPVAPSRQAAAPQSAPAPRRPRERRGRSAAANSGAGRPPQDPVPHQRAADPVGRQWAALVDQATTLGFAVRNAYDGVTAVNWDDKVVHVAVGQQPVERIVALALKIGEISGAAAAVPRARRPEQNAPDVAEDAPLRVEPQTHSADDSAPVPSNGAVQSAPAGSDSDPLDTEHPMFNRTMAELGWSEPPLTIPDTWPSGPVHREPAAADRRPLSTADSRGPEDEAQHGRVAVQQRIAEAEADPVPSDHPLFDRLLAELGWNVEIPPPPEPQAPAPDLAAEHGRAEGGAEPERPEQQPAAPPPPTAEPPEPDRQCEAGHQKQRPTRLGDSAAAASGARMPAARARGGAMSRAFSALGFGRRNGRR